MSRVYFHSPSGTAGLNGSERARLDFVSRGPAQAAWGLDRHADLDKLAEIIGMIPEPPPGEFGANYLHVYLREAQAEKQRSHAAYEADRARGGNGFGVFNAEPHRRLVDALELSLGASNVRFRVADIELNSFDVALNTALAVGAPVIALAAKIHGACELHAWVEGPDRKWLADLIDDGLDIGVYRREVTGHSQGWESVQELLRSRDDEPVVMSYSVCDSFPNQYVANWQPPDGDEDAWYDLPDDQQWELALAGLRKARPWAQITPESLAGQGFHLGVTVYDLLAPDRDERVRRAKASAEKVGV